jgi:ABC-type bacteriocin/lantibiotic exporter with double-glycine peptidase domain
MQLLVAQRRSFDCAVSAAAMFAQVHYNDAFVAAVRTTRHLSSGMTVSEIARMLRRLGCPVRRVSWRRVDLEEDSGLLMINWNRPAQHGATSHAVVLRRGTLIDPLDPSVWDAEDFLKVKNGRVGTLLVER